MVKMSLFKKLMALVVGIFLLLVLFFGGFVVSSFSKVTWWLLQDEVFKKNDVLLGVLSKSVVETSTVSFETKKAIEKLNKSVASLEVAASKFKI